MGVLQLADGRIVGYRVNGRDYPITMANAQRAVAVGNCVKKYGHPRTSNFTAFEFERFCDETGLPPHARHAMWIVRGINHFVAGRPDAVANAATVTRELAPRPIVKRPAARAYDAVTAAKAAYEATRGVEQAAELTVRRARACHERAGRAMGADRAAETLAALIGHADRAGEAARVAKSRFIAACDASDQAYMAAPLLQVAREAQAADLTLALADEVKAAADAAKSELHRADSLLLTLQHEAGRWAGRPRRH